MVVVVGAVVIATVSVGAVDSFEQERAAVTCGGIVVVVALEFARAGPYRY